MRKIFKKQLICLEAEYLLNEMIETMLLKTYMKIRILMISEKLTNSIMVRKISINL